LGGGGFGGETAGGGGSFLATDFNHISVMVWANSGDGLVTLTLTSYTPHRAE
jgi:hypothetical protein